MQSIGDGAFYDCQSLESINIPNSVVSAGSYAFGKCTALETAVVGGGIKSLSKLMFIGCKNLKDVTLPQNLESIGKKAFYQCSSLSQIEIHDTVSSIGQKAFASCCSLSEFITPDSLKCIEDGLLEYNNLNSLVIGKSVSEISQSAFVSTSIKNIFVSSANENYTMVDGVMFSSDMKTLEKCPAVDSVDSDTPMGFIIPNSVTSIAPYAFYESKVSEITFSDNLQTIAPYAFLGSRIESIDIPNSVTQIGENAFEKNNYLKEITIPESVETVPSYFASDSYSLNNITIKDGVKTISNYAFAQCGGVTSITLPSSVTYVAPDAVESSFNFSSMEVSADNNCYTSVDGVLFNKDKTELVLFPCGKVVDEYTVPNTVTRLADYALSGCSAKKVNIPESVTNIGKYAVGFSKSADTFDRLENFMLISNNNSAIEKYANENDIACFSSNPQINVTSASLKAGETLILSVSNIKTDGLAFSSSDQNVAIVDQSGKITAVAQGKTTVIASIGTKYFECAVNVTSGSIKDTVTINSGFDTSPYSVITKSAFKEWNDEYYKFNSNVSVQPLDNSNIRCYTSEEYVGIMAVQLGGSYIDRAQKDFDGDIEQYKIISDNLCYELGRYKQNSNVTLYSGTNNVDDITGKSSSVKDMITSIGKTVGEDYVISTSVDHGVTMRFGSGSYHTVLEFYAPTLGTNGAFLYEISINDAEYELLLNKGNKLKVIDAGVRKIEFTSFEELHESTTERYIKLAIVNNSAEPSTADATTQPVTTAEQTTTAAQSQSTVQPTTAQQTVATPDSQAIPTGAQANVLLFAGIVLLALFTTAGLGVYICQKKNK